MRVMIEIKDGELLSAKADFPLTELIIVDHNWDDGPVAHRYRVEGIVSVVEHLIDRDILVQQGNPSQL